MNMKQILEWPVLFLLSLICMCDIFLCSLFPLLASRCPVTCVLQ